MRSAHTEVEAATGFVLGLDWQDIPADVRQRVAWVLLDLTCVCVAGRAAPAARIAASFATETHPGDAATLLTDGRRTSAPGAAWANGVLANVLDFDDGHRSAKGHPGATVIPSALAAAESTNARMREFLTAVVIGYEIAIRAALELHARTTVYHGSGAWAALGAAAAAGRLLGLDGEKIAQAIGLAEYHAPMAPIMRSVADPAMTKDGTGWGALVGTSAAYLARQGFTGLQSAFLESSAVCDLTDRWRIRELYVKAFPCCRWSQPAIAAALRLRAQHRLQPDRITRVSIRTFAPADELSRRAPRTTEQAQYSIVWPVGVALARGTFDVASVLGGFDDPAVEAIAESAEVLVDPELTDEFPERRRASVLVELDDGSRVESGLTEAPGDHGDADWEDVVEEKVRAILDPSVTSPVVRTTNPPSEHLGGRSLQDLIRLLAYGLTETADG